MWTNLAVKFLNWYMKFFRIVCIKDFGEVFTKGKIYYINGEAEDRIYVVGDDCEEFAFGKTKEGPFYFYEFFEKVKRS